MISFQFVVADADAENIFSIMRERLEKNNLAIMDAMIAGDETLVAAYKRDSEYVNHLIVTMKNSTERV